eukprot:TRINITY_DN6060_c1_g1_i1.p1 TRINITY_DN6060_c1_g1~~TRINITY_DN6060_c1_g1_i1.p1  ORF type:complete len:976 (+),score=219.68 TRINITY_DN6060_c1_g1_i1:154-3081(+)
MGCGVTSRSAQTKTLLAEAEREALEHKNEAQLHRRRSEQLESALQDETDGQEHLQRQTERAYLERDEAYRETSSLRQEIQELQSMLAASEANCSAEEKHRSLAETRSSKLEVESRTLHDEVSELTKAVAEAQAAGMRDRELARAEQQAREDAMAELRSRNSQLASEYAALLAECTATKSERDSVRAELREYDLATTATGPMGEAATSSASGRSSRRPRPTPPPPPPPPPLRARDANLADVPPLRVAKTRRASTGMSRPTAPPPLRPGAAPASSAGQLSGEDDEDPRQQPRSKSDPAILLPAASLGAGRPTATKEQGFEGGLRLYSGAVEEAPPDGSMEGHEDRSGGGSQAVLRRKARVPPPRKTAPPPRSSVSSNGSSPPLPPSLLTKVQSEPSRASVSTTASTPEVPAATASLASEAARPSMLSEPMHEAAVEMPAVFKSSGAPPLKPHTTPSAPWDMEDTDEDQAPMGFPLRQPPLLKSAAPKATGASTVLPPLLQQDSPKQQAVEPVLQARVPSPGAQEEAEEFKPGAAGAPEKAAAQLPLQRTSAKAPPPVARTRRIRAPWDEEGTDEEDEAENPVSQQPPGDAAKASASTAAKPKRQPPPPPITKRSQAPSSVKAASEESKQQAPSEKDTAPAPSADVKKQVKSRRPPPPAVKATGSAVVSTPAVASSSRSPPTATAKAGELAKATATPHQDPRVNVFRFDFGVFDFLNHPALRDEPDAHPLEDAGFSKMLALADPFSKPGTAEAHSSSRGAAPQPSHDVALFPGLTLTTSNGSPTSLGSGDGEGGSGGSGGAATRKAGGPADAALASPQPHSSAFSKPSSVGRSRPATLKTAVENDWPSLAGLGSSSGSQCGFKTGFVAGGGISLSGSDEEAEPAWAPVDAFGQPLREHARKAFGTEGAASNGAALAGGRNAIAADASDADSLADDDWGSWGRSTAAAPNDVAEPVQQPISCTGRVAAPPPVRRALVDF